MDERAALLASLEAMGLPEISLSDDSDGCDVGADELLQALVRAAFSGNVPRCRTALDNCAAYAVDSSSLTSNGRSGLLDACHAGHCEVVALLIARGVRPPQAGTGGWNGVTALQLACGEGHVACTQLLLATGDYSVAAVDRSGATALLKACAAGHSGCASLVLRSGADVDAARPVTLETALHAASTGGHLDCVRDLLRHGARVGLADQHGGAAAGHEVGGPGISRRFGWLRDAHCGAVSQPVTTPLLQWAARHQRASVAIFSLARFHINRHRAAPRLVARPA